MEPKGGSFAHKTLLVSWMFTHTSGQWDIRGDPLLTRYCCSLGSVVYGSHSYSMPAQLGYSVMAAAVGKTERD